MKQKIEVMPLRHGDGSILHLLSCDYYYTTRFNYLVGGITGLGYPKHNSQGIKNNEEEAGKVHT